MQLPYLERRLDLTSSSVSNHCTLFYLPRPMPPCCAICAFCSWKRSPNRSELFKNLSTHRITQPSSLPCRLFDVKSVTQSLKHRWTRFEYIWSGISRLSVIAGRMLGSAHS